MEHEWINNYTKCGYGGGGGVGCDDDDDDDRPPQHLMFYHPLPK